MKLLIASFRHETNTFSPVPTPYERFLRGRATVLCGAEAEQARRGTNTVVGGCLEVAAQYGAEVVVSVVADAPPSGRVQQAAFDRLVGQIVQDAASQPFDGILLDLHGAMAAEDYDDAEGELMRRLRQVVPHTPVGAGLDMHSNLYPDCVKLIDVACGYHTYPHVDTGDVGRRLATLLCRMIQGEIKPVMAWDNRPMLPHIMRQGTFSNPNKGLQATCIDWEQKGTVLSAALFTGFPHADIQNAGVSALVYTDGNQAAADARCQELLDAAWNQRQDFVYQPKALDATLARALTIKRAPGGKPTLLLDHCDNCASGGSMDTTLVLKAAIEKGFTNTAFYGIHDPQAVQEVVAAGIGKTVTVSIGGKSDLSKVGDPNPPLVVTGVVTALTNGELNFHGPMSTGVRITMGTTAVLQVGGIKVVLISSFVEPCDINYFLSQGIDPDQLDYLFIKSRVHWRAGLGHVVGEILECDSIGATTSDYSKLKFERVRRPVFPLDAM